MCGESLSIGFVNGDWDLGSKEEGSRWGLQRVGGRWGRQGGVYAWGFAGLGKNITFTRTVLVVS